MSKLYTFWLGHADTQGGNKLLQRRVQLLQFGTDGTTSSIYDHYLSGNDEDIEIEIADNIRCQLILTDYAAGGTAGAPTVLNFTTPHSFQSGNIRIIAVEDLSSSSSSQSTSSSSSHSSSSSSSSSNSSSSSSQSTSSSSMSTSSVSTSSESSSSSSSVSSSSESSQSSSSSSSS